MTLRSQSLLAINGLPVDAPSGAITLFGSDRNSRHCFAKEVYNSAMQPNEPAADPFADDALMLLVQAGDSAAFDVLVQRYKPLLTSHIMRFIHNPAEAEDIVQDAWLNIFKRRAEFRGETFRAWLFTIVNNLCINYLRKRRYLISDAELSSDDVETFVERAASPDLHPEDLADLGYSGDLADCVGRLPAQLREVVIAYFIDEIKVESLSDLLGVAVGTVSERCRRGLRTIQWCLKQKGHRLSRGNVRCTTPDRAIEADLVEVSSGSHHVIVWSQSSAYWRKKANLLFHFLSGEETQIELHLNRRITGHVAFGDSVFDSQKRYADLIRRGVHILVAIEGV